MMIVALMLVGAVLGMVAGILGWMFFGFSVLTAFVLYVAASLGGAVVGLSVSLLRDLFDRDSVADSALAKLRTQ
ncbi:MAG: hypothetical protein MK098_10805 [Marinovum sp.]|nr:hypothetical protein [Marinovum sp.]